MDWIGLGAEKFTHVQLCADYASAFDSLLSAVRWTGRPGSLFSLAQACCRSAITDTQGSGAAAGLRETIDRPPQHIHLSAAFNVGVSAIKTMENRATSPSSEVKLVPMAKKTAPRSPPQIRSN